MARQRRARPARSAGAGDRSAQEEFERAYRVQINALENPVIIMPALWLASIYFSPRIAAAIGAVWLVARVWYAFAYSAQSRAIAHARFVRQHGLGRADGARGVGLC